MFDLKRIDINTFGNGLVPKFNIHEINIERIKNVTNTPPEAQKKVMKTKDIFESIERRYNKFKYAYYNKGVSKLDLEKINRCHSKTIYMLGRLRGVYRRLITSNDPRARSFGKRLDHAEQIVNKYGNYVDRLNNKKCAKPIQNIKSNSRKIRK